MRDLDQKRSICSGSGVFRLTLVLLAMLTVPGIHAQPGDDWPGRELFENHGAIKLIIDPADGALVAANGAAREFYGYPNLLEMRIGEINLLTEAEVAEEMRRAVVEERNYFLFRHSTAGSGIRDVEVYSYPVAIGGTTYLHSIIFDVTARLTAQQQLGVYRTRIAVVSGAALVAGVLLLIAWAMRTRSRLRTTRSALATTEEVYRSYVDRAPLGIFIFDRTGRYCEVNPEACRMSGYSEEELLGMGVGDMVVPAHERDAEDHLLKLSSEGRSAGEMAFATRSGEIRWWHVVATSIAQERFLGFAEDITDRKRVEEALDHEQKRLAGIIEGTDVGTWEWNTQTGETVFNERWAGILGYSLEEISPVSIQTWQRFAHPDDLARSNAILEQVLRGERELYEAECRMKHRSGHWVSVLDRGKVVSWSDDGKPLMVMGTHLDITERRTAELHRIALADMATELQLCTPDTVDYTRIAETARYLSGAVFAALNLFDSDRRSFTTVAVSGFPDRVSDATQVLGFSLVGKRWDSDPGREAALGDNRTTVFTSPGSLVSSSFPAEVADGIAQTFDLAEVVVTRVQTTAGTLGDFTLLYSRDQHLKNRDLLEMLAGMVGVTLIRIRTEEQNALLIREKETLLKEMQHRIKNNMNTMTSLLSLQADRVRGHRVTEDVLNDVQSRFRSMEILYDRLYRSNGYEGGSVAEYLEVLVRQVVDLFPAADRVSVAVTAQGDSYGNEGRCILDTKRLSTVGLIVNELVTNAMKYAFPDDPQTDTAGVAPATLRVTTACGDEKIEMCVEDNGPGLPDSFDPNNPSGFGTTMVEVMVAQLGGTIRYESPEGPESHGTRVVVAFPVRA